MDLENWKAHCRQVFPASDLLLANQGPCGWIATDRSGQRVLGIYSRDFGFCSVLDMCYELSPPMQPQFEDTQPTCRALST